MSDVKAAIDSGEHRDPVEELAEEFLQRRRQGESVSVTEYADRHPQWAQRIRELFPTLLLMEALKPGSSAAPSGVPPAAPPIGQPTERLGDFRILREVGRGGMGVVYEAEQESLGRRVALKVLPGACLASPNRLRRFQREAQAAARLHHTNIVPVFGVGQHDGHHYYVMQFIPGQGLDRVLRALSQNAGVADATACGKDSRTQRADGGLAEPAGAFSAAEAAHMLLSGATSAEGVPPAGPVPQERAARPAGLAGPTDRRYWRSVARIGIQVAEALEYAHRQGTLHRDIKPANLLLDNRGTVWIADFGLAKLAESDDLTHPGDVVGTLRYMAPEQFDGKADARSDVYSLGLTLYELLTLRPAFDETDRVRLVRQVTQREAPRPRGVNPAIPRDLETIVLKTIASNPAHRYQSARELAGDLQRFLEDQPIRARRATPIDRLWRWCRRNRAVAALAGTALTLLAAVAVVASVGYFSTNRALQRVSEEREQAEVARQQAEDERGRTAAEHARAEANLRLATRAFEDIFSRIASDPRTPALAQDEEDEWPEATWEHVVTDKEAALLEGLLEFYDQFAQQNEADVKLCREAAKAYRRVGDIQRRLGQYDKAEAAYQRALGSYHRLAAASPELANLTSVAAIHNELGVLARSTGRQGARDAHLQALEILRRQTPAAAAMPESRFELARTFGFLATAMPVPRPMRPGPRGGPRPSSPWPPGQSPTDCNRQAMEILEQLTEEIPENTRYRLALARAHRDRCWICAFSFRLEESDQAREKAAELLEQLVVEAPNNPDYRDELVATYAMGYLRRPGQKPPPGSVDQLRRAVELGTELTGQYPSVPEYRASLAHAHRRWAEVLRSEGTLAEAESHLAKSVELQKGLVTQSPSVRMHRFFLARSLDELADVQEALKAPARARVSVEAAIANLEATVANAEKAHERGPGGAFVRKRIATQYYRLAALLRQLGEDSLADKAEAKADQADAHHRPPKSGDL